MRFLPRFLAFTIATSLFAGPARAQVKDAPPVDLSAVLQDLKKLREQQTVQVKQQRQQAFQQVAAAAANGERAVALWADAVRAVQFDGAANEGTAFREWKEREGEGLNTKEGRNAARLFFAWLGLTMQRAAGTPVKELLPQVIGYAKELAADREMMEGVEEAIKRDKEINASGKHGAKRQGDEEKVKRINVQILGKGLAASPVVQWMRIQDLVKAEKWEDSPGNYDGIFNQIILPELRAQRDPRLIEYWEMRLKQEAETASKQKLTFDLEKYNTQRRPVLLWSRAEDMLLLGQKNRAATEMLGVIKSFPQHPQAGTWIARLEAVLVPPAADAAVAAPEAEPVVAPPAAAVAK